MLVDSLRLLPILPDAVWSGPLPCCCTHDGDKPSDSSCAVSPLQVKVTVVLATTDSFAAVSVSVGSDRMSRVTAVAVGAGGDTTNALLSDCGVG